MALDWDDSLEIGIDELDEQHKSIVGQFARLSEAAGRGDAKGLVGEMASFMVEYARVHFENEEAYLAKYDYPKLEEQRREHTEFTREAMDLTKKLEQDGTSREMAIALTGRLARWIIQHIRSRDREAGEYIAARIASEGAS